MCCVCVCCVCVLCHLGTGLSTSWSSPSRADPEHKHPPASAQTHSPAGSELRPEPLEPCTAPSPPTLTNTHTHTHTYTNINTLDSSSPSSSTLYLPQSHDLTSDMAMVSSSPGQQGRLPVSLMDRPKSARTQDRSARTKTFLLVTSLWATAGLYWSEWRKTSQHHIHTHSSCLNHLSVSVCQWIITSWNLFRSPSHKQMKNYDSWFMDTFTEKQPIYCKYKAELFPVFSPMCRHQGEQSHTEPGLLLRYNEQQPLSVCVWDILSLSLCETFWPPTCLKIQQHHYCVCVCIRICPDKKKVLAVKSKWLQSLAAADFHSPDQNRHRSNRMFPEVFLQKHNSRLTCMNLMMKVQSCCVSELVSVQSHGWNDCSVSDILSCCQVVESLFTNICCCAWRFVLNMENKNAVQSFNQGEETDKESLRNGSLRWSEISIRQWRNC